MDELTTKMTNEENEEDKIDFKSYISDRVNILGTEYSIEVKKRSEEPGFNGHSSAYGFCEAFSKRIVLKEPPMAEEEYHNAGLIEHLRKTLRHEIVHAMLHESGLGYNSNSAQRWAANEEMVDWIALQGPKLMECWKEAKALDD